MAAQYELEWGNETSPLHEFEWEADPFIGKAFRRIRRVAGGLIKRAAPFLKKLAPIAARLVAGAIPGVGAIAGPLAGQLVGALTQEQQHELENILHEAGAAHEIGAQHEMEGYHPEFAGEFEAFNPEYEVTSHEHPESYHPEFAGEFEAFNPEFEISHEHPEGFQHEFEGSHPEFEGLHPEQEAHPEMEAGVPHSEAAHHEAMLMEAIAHEAAFTANEAEAEALAGAMVPIALRVLGAPTMTRVAPALARATGRLVGALRRTPATRRLVPVVPTIVRRTNASLVRSARQGVPVTGTMAVRRMANETYRVFNSPAVCIHILIRSGRLRRRRSGMMREI